LLIISFFREILRKRFRKRLRAILTKKHLFCLAGICMQLRNVYTGRYGIEACRNFVYLYPCLTTTASLPMKPHPASISDIAKALGVAPSTVSRALKDHPDISPETRNRIKEFALRVNYRPNALARGLKHQRSMTIGIVIPELVHFFFSSVLSGIEEVAYSNGYRVMICQSVDNLKREALNVQALLDHQVDGMLISISKSTVEYGHLFRIVEREIPVVFFDRVCDEIDSDQVLTDDFEAARVVTSHLLQGSRKRILHLAAPQHLTIGRERCRGYFRALEDHHVEREDALVLHCDTPDKVRGLRDHILDLAPSIDGIFAVNDITAITAMQLLQDAGFRVPEQIGIAGFGDDPVSSIVRPGLTTVEQKGYEMGKSAVSMLLERLETPDREILSRRQVFTATLKIRDSSRKP
jgi:DNA-binding LacI/PurR family transcriptional regulator